MKTDPNILIASSNFGILSADPNGIIASWNNTAQKIFSRTEKDAIGAHIETLLNGHEQKLINDSFQHTLMHKKLSEFEVDVADKNGTNIAIAVSLSPMMDKNKTCKIKNSKNLKFSDIEKKCIKRGSVLYKNLRF